MIGGALAALKALSGGKKLALALGACLLVFAGVKIVQHFIDANNTAHRDLGAITITNTALTKTLERTEKANEAAETIVHDDDARRANCLRHSRTPDNC